MLMSSGSRQVIMAMPAVRFLIIWWAATRMRDSSESRAKSFLMICSQVVIAILIERSTTGCTSSWTARSTDCRTHCFNWGWACSRGIWRGKMEKREGKVKKGGEYIFQQEKEKTWCAFVFRGCNTYIDIYIDVWSQASQGVHIDVMVTELWGWGPSGCAGGGGCSWGWGRSCEWDKVPCWTKDYNGINITLQKH